MSVALIKHLRGLCTSYGDIFYVSVNQLEKQAAQIAEQAATIEALRADADAKQAKIDRLMLEFCPDEMDAKQMASWEEHQQSAAAAKGQG